MRRTRGFSLIEAMIVIVLITGVAMITLNLLNAEQRRQQRNAMVSEQANEMATITRAMEAYLESSDSLPEDLDTPFVLNPQDLVDAGLLPSDFAYRPMSGRVTPTSPLGQEYLLIGVNTSDGYRGALLPTGDTSDGFMARAGLPGTPESLSEFGIAVMQRLKQDHLTAAGVTTAGALAINRDVSGFSFDLSILLAAAPEDPTVISLAGFPEFRPVPPLQIEDGGGDSGARKECFANVTLNEPMSCPAGYDLDHEYELCSDPAGPAQSFVQTGAGRLHIMRSQSTTNAATDTFPGLYEEASARQQVSWTGASTVSETSPACPGTTLRGDNFQITNSGNGVIQYYRMLWCASDGQYHTADTLARTTYNRGSSNASSPPVGLHMGGGYGYYVAQMSRTGIGFTASPSNYGLSVRQFLEEGAMYHQVTFRPPFRAFYRPATFGTFNYTDFSGEDGSYFSTPTGEWTKVSELLPCVEGATNEAPVYLMASPLGPPNSGKKYFAWSVGSSGPPVASSNGTETIRLDGSTLVSNHSCGSRQVTNLHGSCPTVSPSNRRMTTVVSGGGGTRRVGICCK